MGHIQPPGDGANIRRRPTAEISFLSSVILWIVRPGRFEPPTVVMALGLEGFSLTRMPRMHANRPQRSGASQCSGPEFFWEQPLRTPRKASRAAVPKRSRLVEWDDAGVRSAILASPAAQDAGVCDEDGRRLLRRPFRLPRLLPRVARGPGTRRAPADSARTTRA